MTGRRWNPMKLKETLRQLFDPPIVAKLWQLLDRSKALGLRKEDFDNAREALEANEWEVSFNTILVQLYEYEIPITSEFIVISEEIMDEMKIDRREYQFIYKLPIRNSDK